MNRPARSIEIFTMSALDLFVTAMGSFAILMIILFPYFRAKKNPKIDRESLAKSAILFCVWDTRVKDYEQFYKESGFSEPVQATSANPDNPERKPDFWKNPGFDVEPDFPVVNISWDEAVAFCKWLTEKERKAGIIGPEDEYRLPTDAEWSIAAGPDQTPWGNTWPPPADAGLYANYAGKEYEEATGRKNQLSSGGFRDAFELLAPVGSFKPNLYGLFDMGGNAYQWCGDWYHSSLNSEQILKLRPDLKDDGGGSKIRIARGGGWDEGSVMETLFAFRWGVFPGRKFNDLGFRCVLVLKPRSAK